MWKPFLAQHINVAEQTIHYPTYKLVLHRVIYTFL